MDSPDFVFFCSFRIHYLRRKAKIFHAGGSDMNHTPNESIKCTVNSCAHHCQDKNYCSLSAIQVGTHETNPTEVKCTDCESFKLK